MLFVEQKDFVWGLIASMYVGNVVAVILVLLTVPIFAALMRIPFFIIAPLILIIRMVGAYFVSNSYLDVLFMLGFRHCRLIFSSSLHIRWRRWCPPLSWRQSGRCLSRIDADVERLARHFLQQHLGGGAGAGRDRAARSGVHAPARCNVGCLRRSYRLRCRKTWMAGTSPAMTII